MTFARARHAGLGYLPQSSLVGTLELARFSLELFDVPLDCRSGLSLSDCRGLFIELSTTNFRQYSRLFAGSLKASQRNIEGLVLFDSNVRHILSCGRLRRRSLHTEDLSFNHIPRIISAISLPFLYYSPMLILGIETSCDETGLALFDTQRGLLAEALHSQVDLHAQFGGVVPELASRDHVRKIVPLTRHVLAQASCSLGDLDGIAYTAGPGLMGALLVGSSFAKSLALGLGIPALGIHHMEAHLLAPLIQPGAKPDTARKSAQAQDMLPFVALLVSGGHTQLVEVRDLGSYSILGESLDDAAGEAFDKAAKLLGLGYPGGPQIAAKALAGDPKRFRFPRPMTDRPGLNFSFSGLKTFTLNTVEKLGELNEQDVADIARAFEMAAVDTLVIKCRRALEQTRVKRLVIAGGVSANDYLRAQLQGQLDAEVIYAPPALCTDNGAMVAFAGALRLQQGASEDLSIKPRPRWPMTELQPI